jgi:hypothetical protein
VVDGHLESRVLNVGLVGTHDDDNVVRSDIGRAGLSQARSSERVEVGRCAHQDRCFKDARDCEKRPPHAHEDDGVPVQAGKHGRTHHYLNL